MTAGHGLVMAMAQDGDRGEQEGVDAGLAVISGVEGEVIGGGLPGENAAGVLVQNGRDERGAGVLAEERRVDRRRLNQELLAAESADKVGADVLDDHPRARGRA